MGHGAIGAFDYLCVFVLQISDVCFMISNDLSAKIGSGGPFLLLLNR